MKSKMRPFVMLVALALGVVMPLPMAFADSDHQEQSRDTAESESLKQLSAEWWQWVLSFPTSENPLLDTNGDICMVGQRGTLWFLAGNFGGTTTRACSIPEGVDLFFPVINQVDVNLAQDSTTGQCSQGSQSAKELRAEISPIIDGVTNLMVVVDGKPLKHFPRVKSAAFEVAFPTENLFGCTNGGIYSPAVDDGYYVRLEPLHVGNHTVQIQAENPPNFVLNVTYSLTVVPVTLK
jgi:hypothetical protein